MFRPSRRTRVLSLLFAVAQLAMPAASAVADGLAASSETTPIGHVEARTSATCAVVHSPDCGVCRYLSTQSVSSSPQLPPILRRTRSHITTTVAHAGTRPSIVLPPERGPPLSV